MTDNGVDVFCTECGASVLLPFTNDTKTHVTLGPLEGWSWTPTKCPECTSVLNKRLNSVDGGGRPITKEPAK